MNEIPSRASAAPDGVVPRLERDHPLRVAFVAGAGRSGSTLLECLLEGIEGVVAVGELNWIWKDLWSSMVCACGEQLQKCEFWRAVLNEAYGKDYEAARAHVSALSRRMLRHRYAPVFALQLGRIRWARDLALLTSYLEQLYEAIARTSGAQVIIDTTKLPLWGIPTAASASIDLRVVHLVRDPCAVAYSWMRRMDLPFLPGQSMAIHSPRRSVIDWLVPNLEAEVLKRRVRASMLLLYERFATDPSTEIMRIAHLLDLDVHSSDVLLDDCTVIRRGGHALAGNPMRTRAGPLNIVSDDEWKMSLPRTTSAFVRIWTTPLWLHYQHLDASLVHHASAGATSARHQNQRRD